MSTIKKYVVYLNGDPIKTSMGVSCCGVKTEHGSGDVSADRIYVADGGLNFVLKEKILFKKMIWAGDGDSLNKQAKKFIQQRSSCAQSVSSRGLTTGTMIFMHLNQNKDYNDFSALLDKILSENKGHKVFLEIYCGLGGRKDHEYANLLEAQRFLLLLPKGGICFFHGGIILSSLKFAMTGMKNRDFSVFAGTEGKDFIHISNSLYSGKILLERPSHGLSNKGKKDKISLYPQNNSVFCVYVS